MGILNRDFCLNCGLVLFLPFSMNLYTDVHTKLPFTIVLFLTKTDKTSDAASIVPISLESWYLFCRVDHQARITSRVSQAFLESFHNFVFLRTDGAGTSPSPCSKLLAQYFCCRAVASTLPRCFTEKCSEEKSSITASISDVF